ncbi:MAG: TlpA family protein disulfide reductase [Deltaproteobacteria bacterium]|nr:TlpA family protein disulfide reductase [Deltaproteobacteria bacterium]
MLSHKAPDFELKNKENKQVSLKSYRGKVVLLNFWASWCSPCRHEMPSLENLYQKYKSKDFIVLGVSLDEDGWSSINAFTDKVKVSFPIILDEDMQVSQLYQTFRIPESFLIDQSGIVVDQFTGPQDFNSSVFFNKIENLLK